MSAQVIPQIDNQQQVAQMVSFIKAESGEKIQEINQKAAAEYERRFQELKREKEQLVQTEYKAKRQAAHIQRLIGSSHKKQNAQSSLIALRADLVESLKESVIAKLQGIEQHPQYAQLITNLIVQGLISLQEDKITIRVRQCDEKIVAAVLPAAERIFKDAVTEATGYTPDLEPLKIDKVYLPEPYKVGAVEYCLGGVEIVARGGKIVCNNTLDARLQLAYKHLLPNIRAFLFGEVAKKGKTGEIPPHLAH